MGVLKAFPQNLATLRAEHQAETERLRKTITAVGGTATWLTARFPLLVGRLTKDRPDSWADVLNDLLEVESLDAEALERIEAGLRVCLACPGVAACPQDEAGWVMAPKLHLGRITGALSRCPQALAHDRQTKTDRLLVSSGIRQRFLSRTLESFQEDPKNRKALAKARAFVDGWEPNRPGLLILGPIGTGKTHLAVGILLILIRRQVHGVCVTVPELLAEIRAGFADDQAQARMNLVKTVPLLILDDLGTEKVTDWVRETLYVIINARYEAMLPTIITSNATLEELEDRLGPRMVSRLIEMCDSVIVGGPDRRKGDS